MKSIILILIILTSCSSDRKTFWYPVELKEVHCGSFSTKVYLMRNSHYSWIKNFDASDHAPIVIGEGCIVKTIETYPRYRCDADEKLTDFQRKHIVWRD